MWSSILLHITLLSSRAVECALKKHFLENTSAGCWKLYWKLLWCSKGNVAEIGTVRKFVDHEARFVFVVSWCWCAGGTSLFFMLFLYMCMYKYIYIYMYIYIYIYIYLYIYMYMKCRAAKGTEAAAPAQPS